MSLSQLACCSVILSGGAFRPIFCTSQPKSQQPLMKCALVKGGGLESSWNCSGLKISGAARALKFSSFVIWSTARMKTKTEKKRKRQKKQNHNENNTVLLSFYPEICLQRSPQQDLPASPPPYAALGGYF